MIPKERVLMALAHKQTDRAPADYGALQEVNDRLMARLGLKTHEELLQYLQTDIRGIYFSYDQPATGPDEEGYMRTLWGVRNHPSKDPSDPAHSLYPFDENTTVDDVYAHQWPSPDALDYSGISAMYEDYNDSYAFIGGTWSPFYHDIGWIIGEPLYYMLMMTKPEVVHALLECIVSYEWEATSRFLEKCDGRLDVLSIGNDFGTQRGLTISPQSWQRFIRKPLKRFFDLAHDFGCKVMLHSCGGIRDIIPLLIEDGLDILDPVQVRAAGMAFPELVRDFGSRLTFHGGVDTQYTLPFGSTEDVRNQVRQYRDLTREHGGYILSGSQDLIEDIPTDNILAMYDLRARD